MGSRRHYWIMTALALWLCSAAAQAAACTAWQAKVVSIQGALQAQRAGTHGWQPAQVNDIFCADDQLHALPNSRVALVLPSSTIVRLDQNTLITLRAPPSAEKSWLEILKGITHFISRVPRALLISTPFVNAGVDGTEFVINVSDDTTQLTVIEGQVHAENAAGALRPVTGQTISATATTAPSLQLTVRPQDAVHWALYYPPIYSAPTTPTMAEAWRLHKAGQTHAALEMLAPLDDPAILPLRAALYLAVGQTVAAQADSARLLAIDSNNSDAWALRAIIAVVQNDREHALAWAQQAVTLAPTSPAPHLALSYARQMHFDLLTAHDELARYVQTHGEHAVAWARLAELRLMQRDLPGAQAAAQRATQLDARNAHAFTVRGYAELLRHNFTPALEHFQTAIDLDQAAPMPRLGRGLVSIRRGDLATGRRDIEIAVALDPANALLRSYLGKAYFEEGREQVAADQYALAQTFDPQDPTAWFYEALLLQTQNRPGEAVAAFQAASQRNDNRAVYRSRLLLDEDAAARSASLARSYRDLGFEQAALREAWRSLSLDPANYSAHSLLADSYSALPRHEVARVSERLQAQLLQPQNVAPLRPQLTASALGVWADDALSTPAYNEYGRLFLGERSMVVADAFVANHGTRANDLAAAYIGSAWSMSVGQYFYETDGFHKNNGKRQEMYNFFAQTQLGATSTVQLTAYATNSDQGEPMRFDRKNFAATLKTNHDTDGIRLGFHHAFSPANQIIGTAGTLSSDFKERQEFFGLGDLIGEERARSRYVELRQLLRFKQHALSFGAGHTEVDGINYDTFAGDPTIATDFSTQHSNIYVYDEIHASAAVHWSWGMSLDRYDDGSYRRHQTSPKLALQWQLAPQTLMRAAVFRTFKRNFINDQSIEPTQVAGFNQFFDDPARADAWRYGIAIDHRFNLTLQGGVEISHRELRIPYNNFTTLGDPFLDQTRWEEQSFMGYLYWLPKPRWGLGMNLLYDQQRRGEDISGARDFTRQTTWRAPFTLRYSPSKAWSWLADFIWIDQYGSFIRAVSNKSIDGHDRFWVTNGSVRYTFPRRRGALLLGIKNIFDQRFNYQDIDPRNPTTMPRRFVFTQINLSW